MDNLGKWLAVERCPGMGFVLYQRLMAVLPSINELLVLSDSDRQHLGLNAKQRHYFKNCPWALIEKAMKYIEQQKIKTVTIESDNYPSLLKHIARPPLTLFIKGDSSCLHQKQLAIVGSRSPSHYAKQVLNHLLIQAQDTQLTITSGLALGVDGLAHQGAIENKLTTIAVCGSGFQHMYPKRHINLAHQIVEHGALVSEFQPDMPPVQSNFPRRNRIIAGLSFGTLVVEAAVKSGSLITAKYAMEEGRDVFAVPGNIFNPVSQGCHHLIQQGAKLVSSMDDILEEQLLSVPLTCSYTKDLAESNLLASVDYDTTSIDELALRLQLPIEQLLVQLLDLQAQGLITAVPGGYVKSVNGV